MNNDPAAVRLREAMEAGRQARIQEMTTRIQSVGRKLDAAVVAFNQLERNPAHDPAALARAQTEADGALRAVQALQVQADAFFAEDRAQHGRSRKRRRRGTRRSQRRI